ncbi:MAG: acyltransferase family protein [Bacteroidetes bacterium]|nr:acyltransferase family protein [Bacteroidota bacterium]
MEDYRNNENMASGIEARKDWIDLLRAIAIFGVIILHVSVPYVSSFSSFKDINWNQALFLNSSVRFCVPLFLMISGILLLNKNYSLKEFLFKRFTRIVYPFLLWSLIYFFVHHSIQHVSFVEVGIELFKTLKTGAEYHLWYVYMILGLYLFIPIINSWIKTTKLNEVRYYLIIWILVLSFNLPYLNKFYTRIDFVYFTGYLGYLLLGYYLYKSKSIINRTKGFFLYFLGIVLTYFLTLIFALKDNEFVNVFFEYLTPNVILASISIFMIFKGYEIKNPLFLRGVKWISKYSYGTYLSHVAVIIFLSKFNLLFNTPVVFLTILLNAFIILLLSTFLIFGINKLPLGKYISG